MNQKNINEIKSHQANSSKKPSLLVVETKYLIASNEVKRMFGSDVADAEPVEG